MDGLLLEELTEGLDVAFPAFVAFSSLWWALNSRMSWEVMMTSEEFSELSCFIALHSRSSAGIFSVVSLEEKELVGEEGELLNVKVKL